MSGGAELRVPGGGVRSAEPGADYEGTDLERFVISRIVENHPGLCYVLLGTCKKQA